MTVSNGLRSSKTLVGLLTTHGKLPTFTINENNEVVFVSHDADYNSTSKSWQTNTISEYVALSSIHKNENYYAIWKIPKTAEYTSVYYDCSRKTINRYVSEYILFYRCNMMLFAIILLFPLLLLWFLVEDTGNASNKNTCNVRKDNNIKIRLSNYSKI